MQGLGYTELELIPQPPNPLKHFFLGNNAFLRQKLHQDVQGDHIGENKFLNTNGYFIG
jgi:hypothetical protein